MEMATQESHQEAQKEVWEQMRTPKPRPARRGYVIMVVLIGLLFLLGMESMHWSFIETLVIGIVGTFIGTVLLSLPHRGINREIRRRK